MRNQQGIVVTLIVFIVLSLILGVTTYFGFKGLSEKKQELAQKTEELSNATSENSKLTQDFKKVREKLAPGGFEGLDGAKIVEEMGKDIQLAVGDAGVAETYRDAVQTMGKALSDCQQKVDALTKEVAAQTAAAEEQARKTADLQAQFDKDLKTAQDNFAQALTKERESRAALDQQFQAQTQEFDVVKADAQDAIAAAKQETADAQEVAASVAAINVDLSDKIDQLSKAEFSKADASVVYADQINKVVRLDVGSKDGIRPQTTFNVFPPDALDMGSADSKGVVEVVRVVGDHVCEAKIREDEISNPIMPGDLVYTPLWRRGDVIKYALDYKLDINRDGKSDFEEIYNLVETSGGQVAAYINDSGEVVGQIGPDVYAVVVADETILDILARDVSLDDATKAKIQADQADFLKKAKENSVKQITLADFLDRVGYKPTAQVTRYKEAGGVEYTQNGPSKAQVSSAPVAPVYRDDKGAPTASPGIVAPIFKEQSQPAVPSTGKVSDYYFRQRQPKNVD